MRIAYCSDLHLEFADIVLKNEQNADVLVLAGDILIAQDMYDHAHMEYGPYTAGAVANLGRRQASAMKFRDFIQRCAAEFPQVIAIAGNHEFYNGRWVLNIQTLRTEWSKFPNVHFLERDMVDINGIRFVGGTLWTNMNGGDPLTMHAVNDMMNDYKVIRHDELGYTRLRPAHTVSRHCETIDYFKIAVDLAKDRTVVVVSHHAPTFNSVHPRFRHETLMNGAYASNLSEFILDRPQIKMWFHGHMHNGVDYMVGDTRVLANPRGYYPFEPGSTSFELRYVDL